MPSKSKAQSRLMHQAEAIKKGEQKPKGKAAEVAKSMSKGELKKYTKTKQKGLPEKKKAKEDCEKFKKKQKRMDECLGDPLMGVYELMMEGSEEQASEQSMEQNEEFTNDSVDVVEIEVPVLIRIMEYCKENIEEDDEIHVIAENIVRLSKIGRLKMQYIHEILEYGEDPYGEADIGAKRDSQGNLYDRGEAQPDFYDDSDKELGW